MLQVGSYKLRNGKRIFKMAPLHHHFEQIGLARIQGDCPLLDWRPGVCIVCTHHSETALGFVHGLSQGAACRHD